MCILFVKSLFLLHKNKEKSNKIVTRLIWLCGVRERAGAHKCSTTKIQQITRTNNNNGKMSKRTVYRFLLDFFRFFTILRAYFHPNRKQFDPNCDLRKTCAVSQRKVINNHAAATKKEMTEMGRKKTARLRLIVRTICQLVARHVFVFPLYASLVWRMRYTFNFTIVQILLDHVQCHWADFLYAFF